MSVNYLGITIGPIYRTFNRARKTREFWAISYSFSLLASYLINELIEKGQINDSDFILPAKLELDRVFSINDRIGIGLYPDRIICKFNAEKWSLLPTVIDRAIARLADEILQVPGLETQQEEVSQLLRSYYRVYCAMKTTDGNPILEVAHDLDVLEMQDNAPVNDTAEKLLTLFFESVNKRGDNEIQASTFLRKHYSKQDCNGTIRIPSIIEIATEELARREGPHYKALVNKHLFDAGNDKDGDGDFVTALANYWRKSESTSTAQSFKSYHKYICVLKADGDKIGETLRNLPKDQLIEFSKKLINWGHLTLKELKRYGALPIYIGGDDLFCFAPVAINPRDTIFHLVIRLREIFLQQGFPNNLATLSFGLSISYFKFPMAEAFSYAEDLIMEAKKSGGDSIDVKLLKHSGSEFNCHFPLGDNGLLKQYFLPLCDEDINDSSFLSSIMYQIRENESVYHQMMNNQERIWEFICNNFEDAMRLKKQPEKPNPKGKYLHRTSLLIADAFTRYGSASDVDGNSLAIKEIYSLLRLARFIKGLEDADK